MKLKFFAALLACLTAWQTHASVVIIGTRVVYPSDKKSVNVELENRDAQPALVQAWLDKGNANVSPNNIQVPFVITPPVTRVEARSRQTLRVRYTGEPLPSDRESLFYFNLLDVPPKSKSNGAESSSLQVTVRSRLKFFFRPSDLPYDPVQAYERVRWQLRGQTLNVQNDTPYFITYSGIRLVKNKKILNETLNGGMVAPFSSQTFALKKKATGNEQVQWRVINDFGGEQGGITPLTP